MSLGYRNCFSESITPHWPPENYSPLYMLICTLMNCTGNFLQDMSITTCPYGYFTMANHCFTTYYGGYRNSLRRIQTHPLRNKISAPLCQFYSFHQTFSHTHTPDTRHSGICLIRISVMAGTTIRRCSSAIVTQLHGISLAVMNATSTLQTQRFPG